MCPQINVFAGRAAHEGVEDCLFINVFTPDVSPDTPMPVLVWLHGGAFIVGSGGQSPARLAAASEIVVVTLNYRLDELGFMAHPALSAENGGSSGNYGLLDQRAALEWVRDYIAAFGGDPTSVTLAGHSAGAISAALHATAPNSSGLFHRVVVQSGPPILTTLPELVDAETRGVAVADRVGCTDPATALECLRAVSLEDLLEPAHLFDEPGGLFFQGALPIPSPIVDGVVIAEAPAEAFAAGRVATVPWVVGSNGDEGTLFQSAIASSPVLDEAEYRAALARALPDDADAVAAMYPVSDYDDVNSALTAVLGDMFNCRTRRLARDLSRAGATTYLYAFEGEPEGSLVDGLDLRSFHGAELIYLFEMNDPFFGSPPAGERDLIEAMQRYWAGFATAGDPNSGSDSTWPVYNAASDEHMLLVSPPAAGSDYQRTTCDFWDTVPIIGEP